MNEQEINDRCAVAHKALRNWVRDPSKWYLAGGAIESLYWDREPADWDWFCRTDPLKEITQAAAAKSQTSQNALTFTIPGVPPRVHQLITSTYGTPRTVTGEFDFMCCSGWWSPPCELHIPSSIRSQLLTLRRGTVPNPVAVFERAMKYIQRGYEWDEGSWINLRAHLSRITADQMELLTIASRYGQLGDTGAPSAAQNQPTDPGDSKLTHTCPGQDDDGMIVGMDGKKRWF
jgi:hypothetical protein